jgi:hypothetical protein
MKNNNGLAVGGLVRGAEYVKGRGFEPPPLGPFFIDFLGAQVIGAPIGVHF